MQSFRVSNVVCCSKVAYLLFAIVVDVVPAAVAAAAVLFAFQSLLSWLSICHISKQQLDYSTLLHNRTLYKRRPTGQHQNGKQ